MKSLNIGSKLLLFGLFGHYLLNPDLSQYQHKGMAARLVIYPLISLLPLIICALLTRLGKKKITYPHSSDFLITLPLALDTLGNSLNLFDRIVWWDDLMHFVLWGLWVLAIGILIRNYSRLSAITTAGLTLGFGAVTNIVWELAEYLAFVPNNPTEGPTAYRDTMGDMALSLLGSLVGAIIIYYSSRSNR